VSTLETALNMHGFFASNAMNLISMLSLHCSEVNQVIDY